VVQRRLSRQPVADLVFGLKPAAIARGKIVAIYTTFFLSDPQQLASGFPGWRAPLPKSVKRQFKNPFSGETSTVETQEPEWADSDGAELTDREYQVVSIEGNYEDYLEGRLPSFVPLRLPLDRKRGYPGGHGTPPARRLPDHTGPNRRPLQ
jgi:hypothetical protein